MNMQWTVMTLTPLLRLSLISIKTLRLSHFRIKQIPYHGYIQPELLDTLRPYQNTPISPERKGMYQTFQTVVKEGTHEELLTLVQEMSENDSNAFDYCIRFISPDRDFPFEKIVHLPDNHPDNAYAYLLRGNWYAHWAYTSHGGVVSKSVGHDNYDLFYERLNLAATDLRKAVKLLPNCPQAIHKLLEVLHQFGKDAYKDRQAFVQKLLEKFPNHTASFSMVVNYATRKWGGSHEESFAIARKVIEQSDPDSNTPVLLFQAAFERWFWHERFASKMSEEEKADEPQDFNNSDACLEDTELNDELNAYLPRLFKCMSDPQDYSVASWTPWLFMWYSLTEDRSRLQQVAYHAQGRYVTWQFNYLWNDAFRRGYIHWANYL